MIKMTLNVKNILINYCRGIGFSLLYGNGADTSTMYDRKER